MAGPSPYNRKLKARNDRRKARAARGGRTPSEAALGRSMAAAGNRVSKSNQRATAPPSTRTFKSERKPVRARRTSSVDPALRPNAVTGLSEEAQRKTKIVGEDGRELSTLAKAGQIAEVGSALVPVGGGVGTVGRLAFVTGRAAPKAVRAAGAGAKAASTPVKTGSKVKKALKTAPSKTKKKAVQAGKKAKRNVKALGTKKGAGRAAKGAAKAPVKVARRNPAVATGAYTVTADEAGVNDPLTRTIAADTRGIIDAVDSPSDALKTADTTTRAVAGALAGVGALGLAGGITAGRAVSDNINRGTGGRIGKDYTGGEVFSPLVEEAEQTWKGTKEIAKPFVEGDEEGVTRAVQEQLGFLPIVASPRLWSAGRNSRPVQKARQAVRDSASQRRTRKNEEELSRRDEQRKSLGQRGTKEKKLRGSPEDTRYGGEYAMPRVGRVIEATRQRGQGARDAARAKAQADVQTARILRPVEKLIQGMAVPDGKDAKEYRGGAKNAMAVMLNYGIPRDYDAAVKWMDDIERGIAMPDNPPKISDRGAFKFLRDNPEIFKDEKFWEARDILWRNQDEITTSEVKRYLGAGGALGIKNPDERLAEGVELGDGTVVTRERGRKEDQALQRQMAELKNLRAELRAANRSGDMEAVERLAPLVDRKEKALKDITQATKKAEADFVSETQAAMAARGLETPAYVRSWADRERPDQAAPFPASGVLSQRNWIDRDTQRRSGEAERAWDDFVRDSIYRPRAQRIYHDLVSEFAATNAVRLRSARGNSVFLTMAEIERAVKRGEIDPRDFVAFHSQHFRSAVQDPNTLRRKDGIGAFFQLDEKGLGDLRRLDGEIRDRAADRGNKYIIVPRPGADELVKQFQGQGKYRKMAELNRLGSRIVLGYNPSWLIAQFVAEGIPAFTAVGLNPARIRRMRQATRERNAAAKGKRGGRVEATNDPVLARVDDERLRGVVSSGQWKLTRIEEKQDYLGKTRYRYKIEPRPAAYVRNAPSGGSYDSRIAGVQRGKVVIRARSGYSKENPMKASEGYLYRGVSALEMEQIRKTGVIRSRGDMNIVDSQRGTTSFAIDPRTAASYAGGFAPLRYQPTFDSPSYVLRIRDDGFPRANIKLPDNEVSLTGPVPASAIVEVVEVRPFQVGRGDVDVGPGGDGLVVGGVAWPQQSFAYKPIRPAKVLADPGEARISAADVDLFDATAGQTAGTTVIPRRDRGLDTRGKDITTSAPLTKPDKFGQDILSGLKGEGLGRIDRAKGGGFRKMVLAAQIDREVNGFLGGLGGFLKLDGQVKKKLKGMSPAEQQAYLLRNPKTARALENYLDDVMGNWRAISSREEFAASLVAFYPYVRYAIKTAFWGFPKRHPIKTSMLYFLAQLNANELEEIVGDGGNVLDWINYAFPVVSMDGGRKVAPGAARVAPALSVVVEAIGTGRLERIMSGLTPLVGVVRQTIQGQDFTGRDVSDGPLDSLLVGLAALVSMVAPVRAIGNTLDPEGKKPPLSVRSFTPRRTFDDEGNETTVIGGRSTTSEYLAERDVDRGIPSIFNPFQMIDEQDFKERQEIIDLLNRGAWRQLPGSVTGESVSSSSSSTPASGSTPSPRSAPRQGGTPIVKIPGLD